MKKYLLNLLLILTTLSLAACGSNSEDVEGNTSSKGGTESNTSETIETPKENAEEVEEPKTLTINLGETLIAEDFAEVTVQSNKFGKVVNPPSPGSFYSYYEVKEKGEIYLDTVITVKSLLTSQRTSDEFVDVKIVYDDKYEYTTFLQLKMRVGQILHILI